MSTTLGHLITAVVVTLVVGAASGGGWAYFAMGAVLALSLWVMLFAGSSGVLGRRAGPWVSVGRYAVAATLAVALGYAMTAVGDGASWWAVGFVLAGVLVPAGRGATQQPRVSSGTRDG